MSTELDDRVSDLLSAVREELASGAIPEDVDADSIETVGEEIDEHAATAREVLETNDPESILEAVGLAELPDGSEPSSIPEAIARGPEEQVRDLHALVTLASLAERGADEDADELESALSDLRETLDVGAEGEPETEDEAGEEEETGDGADGGDAGTEEEPADDAEAGDEADEEAGAEDDGADEPGAEPSEGDDEADSDLGETLRAAAGTGVEGFSEDVRSLRSRLEALAGGEGADDEDESEDDSTAGENGGDGDEADESDEEEDDGRFDFGGGLGGDRARGRSSMHSTMPPRPSERADMRAVRRHSTMPDRH